MARTDEPLIDALAEGVRLGFIGGPSISAHMEHARRFPALLGNARRVLDLGSGGGLPGLVLAWDRPRLAVVLLDANRKRTDFLHRAIGRLGLAERVVVWMGRAEVLGRDAERRATQDAVVARSFGAPGLTAECASPFLRLGGRLVVSEPPGADDRWPVAGLALCGLRPLEQAGGLRAFEQTRICPDRYPRRRLRPPLF